MKKVSVLKRFIFVFTVLVFSLVACSKEEDDKPVGTEPINFIQPDSSTIFASSGELVDFSLYLSIDQAIDSVRGAYYIDTAMSINNLTFSDMETQFFAQAFIDSQNVQTVSGVLEMPQGRNDSVPFRQYFSGSTTPFIPAQYDAVRVVFRIDGDSVSYEKQLKIIVK